jgi:micrococcal nuclease
VISIRSARVAALAATLALSAACASLPGPGAQDGTPASTIEPSSEATSLGAAGDVGVVRVVDGDTIVVAIGGPKGTKVRLIGIDTPERDHCYFGQATDRMRSLVEGRRVRLQRDVSETDRYGRLLRYVYVGKIFVNAIMVSEGFAAAATYPPDVAHAGEFIALERAARLARRGLWGPACAS